MSKRIGVRKAAPPPPPSAYSVTDYGATGNGSTDDTVAIQSAMDAAVAAGKQCYFPVGHYKVSISTAGGYKRALEMASGASLLLHADAYLELATTSETGYFYLLLAQNKSNVTVDGGRFVGDRATHPNTNEHGMNVGFISCAGVTVKNLHSSQACGDGVYFGGANAVNCTNVVGSYITCDQNRRNGMSLVAVETGAFDHCYWTTNGVGADGLMPKNGLDLEPNANYNVFDCTFTDCEASGNGDPGVAVYWNTASTDALCHGHTFTRVTSQSNIGQGFVIDGDDIHLTDCVGILNDKTQLVLRGNYIHVAGGTFTTHGSAVAFAHTYVEAHAPSDTYNQMDNVTVNGSLYNWSNGEASSAGTVGEQGIGTNTFLMPTNGIAVGLWSSAHAMTVDKAYAYIDGGGSGTTSQKVRVVVFDANAVFGYASTEVTIPKGQAAGWQEFVFPTPFLMPAGDYGFGLWAGANTNVIRGRYDPTGGIDTNCSATYSTSGNPTPGTWSGQGTALYSFYLSASS